MKKFCSIIAALCTAVITSVCAFATSGGGDIASSVAVTGTTKLLNDVMNALLIVAPIVGTACVIYFSIRHSAADEMDQKQWKKRIVVAIVSTVFAVLAAATINVIVGYYQ